MWLVQHSDWTHGFLSSWLGVCSQGWQRALNRMASPSECCIGIIFYSSHASTTTCVEKGETRNPHRVRERAAMFERCRRPRPTLEAAARDHVQPSITARTISCGFLDPYHAQSSDPRARLGRQR